MDGIIKFKADWNDIDSITDSEFEHIDRWRTAYFKSSLIGIGDDGIGYGNISYRIKGTNEFIISGSATGGIPKLTKDHYSRVTSFNLNDNFVSCEGRTVASSESMSHAAIYMADKDVNCILHFHDSNVWANQLNILPTTDANSEYGTVDMAKAIYKLVEISNSSVVIMGGHQDGIIIYGEYFDGYFDGVLGNLL